MEVALQLKMSGSGKEPACLLTDHQQPCVGLSDSPVRYRNMTAMAPARTVTSCAVNDIANSAPYHGVHVYPRTSLKRCVFGHDHLILEGVQSPVALPLDNQPLHTRRHMHSWPPVKPLPSHLVTGPVLQQLVHAAPVCTADVQPSGAGQQGAPVQAGIPNGGCVYHW